MNKILIALLLLTLPLAASTNAPTQNWLPVVEMCQVGTTNKFLAVLIPVASSGTNTTFYVMPIK